MLLLNPRSICLVLLVLAGMPICVPSVIADDEPRPLLMKWNTLPSLPDTPGFGGPFAGVSGDALIVAGGANFPEKPPWEGGEKVWHDQIYVLDKRHGEWRVAQQRLPRGWAYGVSVTVQHESVPSSDHLAVLCVGGDDGKRCLKDVSMLIWTGDDIEHRVLRPLPRPVSQACGALVGKTVYIAGGIESVAATQAMNSVFAMDISGPPEKWFWRSVISWRGAARMQSVAGSMDGKFYLFGGVRLDPKVPKHHRVTPYLKDCYCFTPGKAGVAGTWQRLADLPRPIAAAPSPACRIGTSRLAIAGGVDGSMVNHDQATHPGFTRDFTVYDVAKNKWSALNKLPKDSSRVTAPSTEWRGSWLVVSGESRPGVRSPKIFAAQSR